MVVLTHSHQINRKQCILVNESTTLRHHTEANFTVCIFAHMFHCAYIYDSDYTVGKVSTVGKEALF